ncbi:group 1 glycosyl transferase [Clostridium disporicum]|uniref:Group 1 glycosyl transferase n=2 Tax=Clostridium disporicum TaxID=84024 RepID=A0A174F3E3_9CLOT|nr:group 1 glycosyl transferase [Clostridium disporicum]
MKILVVSQYFWPEEFRINDICEGLIEQGHEVEVLTGIPNYPHGNFFEGHSIFKPGVKEYKGAKIRRVPLVPRGKDNFIKLGLNYISYTITASIASLGLLFNKYDRVFVFQLSPITLAIPGIIVSKIKKIPSIIYVQDLWPESLFSIKEVNNTKVRGILDKICSSIYKSFDKLLITSKSFEEELVNKGVSREKIDYFPQWAEDFYSLNESSKKNNKEEFVITFAGNIGKAQSVDTIIKAAKLAKKNKNIKWQILGDGSEFKYIKSLVNEFKLNETVSLLGRKPASDMPKYFSESDALIVTLKDDKVWRATLPAKVQSYMASGKPILAAISGEGNSVIKQSKCGLVGEAEDHIKLYENVIELYNMSEEEREILGNNGKKYFEDNFTRKILLNKLEQVMN